MLADRYPWEGGRPAPPDGWVARAALSGASYASAGAAAMVVLLIVCMTADSWYTTNLTRTTYGGGLGPGLLLGVVLFFGMAWPVGLVFAVPLGAVLGAGNGLLASTRWGGGWPAVVAVGVAVGAGAGVLLPFGGERDVLTALIVVCSGTSCALHLRRQQQLLR